MTVKTVSLWLGVIAVTLTLCGGIYAGGNLVFTALDSRWEEHTEVEQVRKLIAAHDRQHLCNDLWREILFLRDALRKLPNDQQTLARLARAERKFNSLECE